MRRFLLAAATAAFLLPLTACGSPAREEEQQEQGEEGGEEEEGEGEGGED
jgi:hypothetical protein